MTRMPLDYTGLVIEGNRPSNLMIPQNKGHSTRSNHEKETGVFRDLVGTVLDIDRPIPGHHGPLSMRPAIQNGSRPIV
jgi:hypothetical protein